MQKHSNSKKQLLIEANNIAWQFDGSNTALFSHINLSLHNEYYALVGRNGVGKSWLAAVLANRYIPTEGSVNQFCPVGYLTQGVCDFSGNGADLLGVTDILAANQRMAAGKATEGDFLLLENRWNIEHQLDNLLQEGGLASNVLAQPVEQLSGGERIRLSLLALKSQGAGFLILDEPSNHLDRQGRIWLANWLRNYVGGLLIVTHDERLLNEVDIIYELDSIGIQMSRGGWQSYLQTKQQQLLSITREVEQSQKKLQQVNQRMQQDKERVSQSKSKGKQARIDANQSKLSLDFKAGRADATQTRLSQANSERVSHAVDELKQAKERLEIIDPLSMVIATPKVVANPLLSLTRVQLPYGTKSIIESSLISGERLAIIGGNGSGKSTLLKVISGELMPAKGNIFVTKSCGFMDQHFSLLDKQKSALENFQLFSAGWREDQYRTRLAQLRIRGNEALKPVNQLSGGEQLKVALACLFCGNTAPALLLLDEPDNHLDNESKSLLKTVLSLYSGAIVVVSHDDYFFTGIGVTHYIDLDVLD